jgi:GT2 family glycosyltransferase
VQYPSVTIIIPNYNGAAIIDRSLEAVCAAAGTYPAECEVLVVDDASTDGSVGIIAERHPEVVLVRHDVNAGFADAVHTGVDQAANEVLIILNSDVIPAVDFIAPLVAPLGDETVFAASPLILNPAGHPLFNSWARYRLVKGKLRPCNWTLDDVHQYQERGRSLNGLYASGGSMAVTRKRFQRLGGFLPIYKPFYSEDSDLGTRAWMCGWATRFVPESKVVHASGSTIKRFFPAREVRITRIRNQLIYQALYTTPGDFLRSHLPWILLRTLTRLLRLDTTLLVGLVKAFGAARQIRLTRMRVQASQPFKTLEQVLRDLSARP